MEKLDDNIDDNKISNIVKNRWNSIHQNNKRENVIYDDWLDLFEKVINESNNPIIDLGCGTGNDTLYLLEKGKQVIPCDYSENAMKSIDKNFPEIKRKECFDMTKGLPFEDNFTDIIIADLSLHYFNERTTFEILKNVKRVLKPNGLLIFRVNSINDINHGAGKGIEVEKHLFKTNDMGYKRFFDENDIKHFFNDWNIIYMKEEEMTRYQSLKKLWRCAAKVTK